MSGVGQQPGLEALQRNRDHVGLTLRQPDAQLDRDDRADKTGAISERQAHPIRLEENPWLADAVGQQLFAHALLDESLIEIAVDLLVGERLRPRCGAMHHAEQVEEFGGELQRATNPFLSRGSRGAAMMVRLVVEKQQQPRPGRTDQETDDCQRQTKRSTAHHRAPYSFRETAQRETACASLLIASRAGQVNVDPAAANRPGPDGASVPWTKARCRWRGEAAAWPARKSWSAK